MDVGSSARLEEAIYQLQDTPIELGIVDYLLCAVQSLTDLTDRFVGLSLGLL